MDPVRRRATISERTFSRRAKRITEAALLFTLPFLGGAMANLSIPQPVPYVYRARLGRDGETPGFTASGDLSSTSHTVICFSIAC